MVDFELDILILVRVCWGQGGVAMRARTVMFDGKSFRGKRRRWEFSFELVSWKERNGKDDM